MLFGTPLFLLGFLPLTLVAFTVAARIAGSSAALTTLLAANFVFYGFGNLADCLLLAASILGNWWVLPKVAQRPWYIAAILSNLALLGLFKYGGLIARSLGLPVPALALPLGISFFSFQQLVSNQPISKTYKSKTGDGPSRVERCRKGWTKMMFALCSRHAHRPRHRHALLAIGPVSRISPAIVLLWRRSPLGRCLCAGSAGSVACDRGPGDRAAAALRGVRSEAG
ncbi:hypothetical protein ACELLULO517_07860 [Acidisoma cellulosilytica]|uniref:Uncharacterized protein n=1 Tax=Acidisoma cellulosilyticum TaxID=2802395 RepID=A0A963YZW6_9PROT|nr:hypothetical protein [Acidisoma cellulosilyticum]MCB8880144.1 hypothetical protein [Acidisoma cellulosilyticum]